MANSYEIEFTKQAYQHLNALKRSDRNRILDVIKQQLTYDPNEETKNKKILRENPLSDWELRIQPFRVFYDIDDVGNRIRILAIGKKDRERLIIGGQEITI